EVDAVFFRRDGEVVRFTDDLEARDVDLVSPWGARVSAHGAGHHDGAFLRQMTGVLEHLVADRRLRHHRLNEPGPVAHLEEMNLAARPPIGQPALQGDGLPIMLGDVFDVRVHEKESNEQLTMDNWQHRKRNDQDWYGPIVFRYCSLS